MTTRTLSKVMVCGAVLAAAATAANASSDALTDAALVSRASAVFAVKEPPTDRVLGIHRGALVFVDVFCSDVCPANTVRVIHYQVGPGPLCTQLGGDSVSIVVPITVGARPLDYCIPHILYRRHLYTDRPYQTR